MKIKIPQTGGEKPASTGKVSPSVTPATPVCTPTPSRRGKTCCDTWKCCDWTLLAFIIIIGGGLTFKMIAHATIKHKMDAMFRGHHPEANRKHAECKVVHVQDNGMRACSSCNRGVQGDQLEHGWWDWMENAGDDAGWQKDGFFRQSPKKCPKFVEFEKKTWEEFKVKTANQPEEIVLEEKILVRELLKKELFTLCGAEHMKEKEMKDLEALRRRKPDGKPERKPEDKPEGKPEEPPMRQKRSFNKGNMGWSKSAASSFPCHEVVVEVNPKGKHRQWRESEEGSWEGMEDDDRDEKKGRKHGPGGKKGGMKERKEGMKEGMKDRKEGMKDSHEDSHEDRPPGPPPPGHHPHHGRRTGEDKPRHPDDLDDIEEELKHKPKDAKDAMGKFKKIGESYKHRAEDMAKRGVHHATLYDSKYTAGNHKQCSVSICKDDAEKNKKSVGNFITEFKKMWEEGESFPCYYESTNKMQVWELEPWDHQMKDHERNEGDFQHRIVKGLQIASGVMLIIWIILIVAFSIRRCMQCKRAYSSRRCGGNRCSRYQTNQPQVVTVDSPTMSEKEKEAMEPPATPRSVWTSDESAPSAPPSYVTLDATKGGDFKAALNAWAEDQDKAVKKAEEASEA